MVDAELVAQTAAIAYVDEEMSTMHRALKTGAIAASILAPIACAAPQGPAGESARAAGSAGMATTTTRGATTTTTSTSTNTAACVSAAREA